MINQTNESGLLTSQGRGLRSTCNGFLNRCGTWCPISSARARTIDQASLSVLRPKSKGAIPVIAQLKLLLDQHWERCGRPRKGFIFANELGNPMNLEALAVDVIRPALEKANLTWHGWHAFRRGLATNLHRLGVSDKVIQQILRHANVSTTMNIYVKTVSADAANAMKTLKTMCNYCATREARKYANYVEVFLAGSQQVSTLDAVRGNLAERGGFEPPVGVLAPTTV